MTPPPWVNTHGSMTRSLRDQSWSLNSGGLTRTSPWVDTHGCTTRSLRDPSPIPPPLEPQPYRLDLQSHCPHEREGVALLYNPWAHTVVENQLSVFEVILKTDIRYAGSQCFSNMGQGQVVSRY